MLFISLAFSAILTFLCAIHVLNSSHPRRAVWNCLFGLIPAFATIPCMFFLPAYFFHVLAMAGVAAICSLGNLSRSAYMPLSLSAFIGVYCAFLIPSWNRMREVVRLYPTESVVDRLAYEGELAVGTQSRPTGEREFNQPYDERVYLAEIRSRALRSLHEDAVSAFVDQSGFGVGRMPISNLSAAFRAEPIRLAEPVPATQPPLDGYSPPASSEDSALSPTPGANRAEFQSLLDSSVRDFADPLAFGYVRDRRNVTGFLSHRFTKHPDFSTPAKNGSWRVETLDLVSLLKHKEPVAYVSKNLPRMDELRDAPTRPLDEFERERLTAVRNGENLSAAEGPRRMRMLGAIRAQAACLKCHNVAGNALLGAFSYDLRLDLPTSRSNP